MRITPQHLADLGRLLRAEGFAVTADHELKLQAVFRLFADVEPERVRRLVAPVVLEAPDQAEGLERVLDRWLPGVCPPPDMPGMPNAPRPTMQAPVGAPNVVLGSQPETGRPARTGLVLAAMGLMGLLLWLGLTLPNDAVEPDTGLPAMPTLDAGPLDAGLADAAPIASQPDAAAAPSGTYRAPIIVINEHQPSPRGWLGALALLSLLGAAALYLRRRDDGLPGDLPPPDDTALAPPARARAQLADTLRRITTVDDRRALIWGVDHFLSDDESQRLDLRASVRATARAADRPVTVFARERRARAVWLWIDADAQTDAPERLAAELAATLTANGLDVHRAWFEGVPDVLFVNGTATDPDDLGTPIQGSVVAVLTDGRALEQVDPSVARGALAGLSLWPKLAVVDFADDATELTLRLRPHGVPVIAPESLARWLGGEGDDGSPGEVDLTAWLAACALAPTPVDPTDVLELGQVVGVPTPARHLPAIQQDAHSAGGRLSWPWPTRASRLDWLGRQPDLLHRAVDQWTLRHAPGSADTATNRARAVERAIVQLWTRPDAVAELLCREASQRLRVQGWLRGLTTADAPARPGVARLPWTWADVTPQTQRLLRARGFGGQILLPTPARKPWWAIGALGATALASLVLWLLPQAVPDARFSEVGERPADAVVRLAPDGVLTAGTRPATFTAHVPEGAHAILTWGLAQQPCQRFEGEVEHWLCLDDQPAQHPAWRSGKPGRDLVLPIDSTDAAAAHLARRVLETGAADTVIFGTSPPDALRERWVITPKSGDCGDADLCVQTDDLNTILPMLGGDWRPAAEIWPTAQGSSAQTMQIPGGGPSNPPPITLESVTPKDDGWLEVVFASSRQHIFRARLGDTAEGTLILVQLDASHAVGGLSGGDGQRSFVIRPSAGGIELVMQYRVLLPPSFLKRLHVDQTPGQLRMRFPPSADAALAWIDAGQLKLSRSIRFEFDATQLRLDQRPMLQAVATLLKTEVPKHRLQITGHSAEPRTQRRSLKRAQAVQTYLLNADIAFTRLEVKGVGDREPLAKGDTGRARAQNRRVELVLLSPVRPTKPPKPLIREPASTVTTLGTTAKRTRESLQVMVTFSEPIRQPKLIKKTITRDQLTLIFQGPPVRRGWKAKAERGVFLSTDRKLMLRVRLRLGKQDYKKMFKKLDYQAKGPAFVLSMPIHSARPPGNQPSVTDVSGEQGSAEPSAPQIGDQPPLDTGLGVRRGTQVVTGSGRRTGSDAQTGGVGSNRDAAGATSKDLPPAGRVGPAPRASDKQLLADARKRLILGDSAGAVQKLKQALKLKKRPSTYRLLCTAYMKLGNRSNALRACKKWAATESNSAMRFRAEKMIQQLGGRTAR